MLLVIEANLNESHIPYDTSCVRSTHECNQLNTTDNTRYALLILFLLYRFINRTSTNPALCSYYPHRQYFEKSQ